MEKLVNLLWKHPQQTVPEWRESMRSSTARTLRDLGAQKLQFNVVDEHVASGDKLRIITREAPDGLLMFWLPSANGRAALETLLVARHARIAGYLVTESCIKAGTEYSSPGSRTSGFSLIGFLQRPSRLGTREWLYWWLDQHTRVAVDTQSTFRYVQNVVARTLTEDAPTLDALVEEGFPTAALTSPNAFYDAEGDDDKYQRNLSMMMESCHRFIDFDRIDSMPMSEYLL